MRSLTADTHTWLAARGFLLDRSDDFFLQLTRAREAFDPEAIHDLRVASRRLREGIALFGHCFRKRQLAPLRKELKDLTTMLGSIRNTDEAILFFSNLPENRDSASAGAAMKIVATLQTKRGEEQRELKRELKKIDPGALLGRIDGFCSNPRIFNPDARGLFQPIADCLLEAMAVREKAILELLPEALVEENVSAQHRLRIAVKHFRYRLEFMSPLASDDYKKIYSALKEYQEVLGHMHDLDVFIGMTGEITAEQSGTMLLHKIINDRRRILFSEFLQHQATNPLDEMGNRVRSLL
ncbi:MAG TPA: CHAD domain-containing protein [Dongiaceae bacterium]|nr:CHAD domain-containing protein [Dongiaceae bacterium]